MKERFNSQPQAENFEDTSKKERIENLSRLLNEAEAIFEAQGRETAKPLLNDIYSKLISLNKPGPEVINPLAAWNTEGDLTEEQFNALNLRRKKLSNAIGIMTASGVVRHDLNKL